MSFALQGIIISGIFAVNNDGNSALHYLVRSFPKDNVDLYAFPSVIEVFGYG
jgi:hypothetical protein